MPYWLDRNTGNMRQQFLDFLTNQQNGQGTNQDWLGNQMGLLANYLNNSYLNSGPQALPESYKNMWDSVGTGPGYQPQQPNTMPYKWASDEGMGRPNLPNRKPTRKGFPGVKFPKIPFKGGNQL